jgi:Guanylate kinase
MSAPLAAADGGAGAKPTLRPLVCCGPSGEGAPEGGGDVPFACTPEWSSARCHGGFAGLLPSVCCLNMRITLPSASQHVLKAQAHDTSLSQCSLSSNKTYVQRTHMYGRQPRAPRQDSQRNLAAADTPSLLPLSMPAAQLAHCRGDVATAAGVGKGTLIGRLLKDHPDWIGFSVSHTTRQPRPGEVHGVHYYFCSVPDMEREIADGAFIEVRMNLRMCDGVTARSHVLLCTADGCQTDDCEVAMVLCATRLRCRVTVLAHTVSPCMQPPSTTNFACSLLAPAPLHPLLRTQHALVHGNMYGTSLREIERIQLEGRVCVLDIDTQACTTRASCAAPIALCELWHSATVTVRFA